MLTEEERLTLERLTNRRKTAQALRGGLVSCCRVKPGAINRAVAAQSKVSEAVIGKWRRRLVEKRLDGLFDGPRPGEKAEAVIVKTLEEKPADGTHWSTRSMAKAWASRRRH